MTNLASCWKTSNLTRTYGWQHLIGWSGMIPGWTIRWTQLTRSSWKIASVMLSKQCINPRVIFKRFPVFKTSRMRLRDGLTILNRSFRWSKDCVIPEWGVDIGIRWVCTVKVQGLVYLWKTEKVRLKNVYIMALRIFTSIKQEFEMHISSVTHFGRKKIPVFHLFHVLRTTTTSY